jgi:hemin uptake protein HemP
MVGMAIPNVSVPSHAEVRIVAQAPGQVALRQWPSNVLVRGGRDAIIANQGAHYRLSVTASGKLILTK